MLTRLHLIALALANTVTGGLIQPQQPLQPAHDDVESATTPAPQLHGRFLHITDLHPDSFYKVHSATDGQNVCHHGKGDAGPYGAEVTGCDSPWSLIDATFDWIAENVRDQIDFVVWTGDSARHNNDKAYPRDSDQVLGLNRRAAKKFLEVFGTGDRHRPLSVPVVPNIGNNDVLPHNAFFPGPNKWTRSYLDVWREFIPKSQRHAFDRGGWHWNEVVPGRLAVVSVNSLYWYTKNAAVDGCADPGEPGYAHFEWLRVQLQLLRERGLKVIVMGHVPPVRTESKQPWDESCWQKYALWMHRYRDIIVGSVWGHVNTDHFVLQDVGEVTKSRLRGKHDVGRDSVDSPISIQSTENYLNDLRKVWSKLPRPPKEAQLDEEDDKPTVKDQAEAVTKTTGWLDWILEKIRRCWRLRQRKETLRKTKKFLDKIGGQWAERYTLDLVSPSMVPNYYPTLRVVNYNISGLGRSASAEGPSPMLLTTLQEQASDDEIFVVADDVHGLRKKHKKHRRKHDSFKMPKAPSKSTPPGPAHSPQTFSWLSYQQLFLNITTLNHQSEEQRGYSQNITTTGHLDEGAPDFRSKAHNRETGRNVTFEVEYDTKDDKEFALKDLTVRSFVQLAKRIGNFKPEKGDTLCRTTAAPMSPSGDEDNPEHLNQPSPDAETKRKKHKKHKKHNKKKHGKRKIINRTWYAFVQRAYVNTLDKDELHDNFGQPDYGESARLCRGRQPSDTL